MPDWAMLIVSPALVLAVLTMARKAALDLDARGQPGWVYGIMVMLIFPFGMVAWLLARERYAPVTEQDRA